MYKKNPSGKAGGLSNFIFDFVFKLFEKCTVKYGYHTIIITWVINCQSSYKIVSIEWY